MINGSDIPALLTRMMNPTLETIFRRRSIRKFTDQPLDKETITLLLQAGMAAPSAVNSQPWEFIVVTEPEVLAKLRRKLPFAHQNAPAGIVVLGNPERANNTAGRAFWQQDCSAAMENMLIAAVGLGLGAVWIGIHPIAPFVRAVKNILDIPDEATPLGMMHVGYPAEEKIPRTRYVEHKVYWQKYEKRKRSAKIKNAKLIP
jgi:nitroreductase